MEGSAETERSVEKRAWYRIRKRKEFYMEKAFKTKLIAAILSVLLFAVVALLAGVPIVSAELTQTIYYDVEVSGELASIQPTAVDIVSYPEGSTMELGEYASVGSTFPVYHDKGTDLTNQCACVAGTMLVAYYDRYYENLLPGASAYSTQYNRYVPMGMISSYVRNTTSVMYDMMGTNTIEPGTSESQFFDGIEEYCESKGRTLSKTSVTNNGNINLASVKQQLRNGKPVVMFATVHNETMVNMTNSSLSIVKSTVPHVFIAWGYYRYDVYNASNTLIDTVEIFRISNGQSTVSQNVYIDSEYLSLENAYACTIS